jgi:ribosomal protein S18 acetylase RimI-like enzyme
VTTEPTVRLAEPQDIPGIVALHEEAFPDYLLTLLGSHLLTRFYSGFLTDPGSLLLVALANDRICGFTVATTNPSLVKKRFCRQSALPLASTIARRAATSRTFRWQLSARVRNLPISVIESARRRINPQAPKQAPSTRLLSIATSRQQRRMGVAAHLVEELTAHLAQRGIETVGLSVRRDNTSAIAFYERNGWTRSGRNRDLLQFTLRTSRSDSGHPHAHSLALPMDVDSGNLSDA